MDEMRQVGISFQVGVAFFESHLRAAPIETTFLSEQWDSLNTDLTHTFE
jgi:hypothetical protein